MKMTLLEFKNYIIEQAECMLNETADRFTAAGGNKVVDAEGNPLTVYHGTDAKFSKFSLRKSAMPVIWFTDSREHIEKGESGAAGRTNIMVRQICMINPAGWNEYEKYGIGQLKDLHYDGVILAEPGHPTNYIVFDPKNIRSVPKIKSSRHKPAVSEQEYNIINNVDESNPMYYHGTGVEQADSIKREGFWSKHDVNLTTDFSEAKEYANIMVNNGYATAPFVLKVRLKKGAMAIGGSALDDMAYRAQDVVLDFSEIS